MLPIYVTHGLLMFSLCCLQMGLGLVEETS